METLGTYKSSTVFLDYDPSKAPFMWIVWCRCSDIFNGHGFPTEGEARAFAAGRYHLPAEECNADPWAYWPDPADWWKNHLHKDYAVWPDRKKGFFITECPDGAFILSRGNDGYRFPTEWECWAFAAGRNWCGIKWYRSARKEGADDE